MYDYLYLIPLIFGFLLSLSVFVYSLTVNDYVLSVVFLIGAVVCVYVAVLWLT